MKKFFVIFVVLLFSWMTFSGCGWKQIKEPEKKTGGRLTDRSRKMLAKKKAGIENKKEDFENQVTDSELNERTLGSPKERTNIDDPVAVKRDQEEHEKVLQKTPWWHWILTGLGFVGTAVFGSRFTVVNKVLETVTKGVEKHRNGSEGSSVTDCIAEVAKNVGNSHYGTVRNVIDNIKTKHGLH